MAKSKKTTISKKNDVVTINEPIIYLPCEWVIQFDDDEPQIFATADETSTIPEVVIKLQNTSESHITFTDTSKNKKFRIYARPKLN
jgi:hypothetical protein